MTTYSTQSQPTGIKFMDLVFTEPARFSWMMAPPRQGIYVVLVPDSAWGPRQFRPIYFGESSFLPSRIDENHEKYKSWLREAGGMTLHVSFLATQGLTDQQRKRLENDLICRYDTPCNIKADYSTALRRALYR